MPLRQRLPVHLVRQDELRLVCQSHIQSLVVWLVAGVVLVDLNTM